jgi:Kef-type K+ transport system membrane component KefB
MTTAIIITFCVLLLISYFFDLTSSKTKIPSVILLLLLGWFVRQLSNFFGIQLPDFSPALPILGSIGLILIVLEGSLELELNKSKIGLIRKSFFGSLIPVVGLSFLIPYLFNKYF